MFVHVMGNRIESRAPMAWQGTLSQMKEHRSRIAQTCTRGDCRRWHDLNVDDLILRFGPDFMLWDRRPPCTGCGEPTHYMVSPGPATPFRPLLSGLIAEEVRRRFLRSFGFTARDVRRIQAMAENCTRGHEPAALADLDVPYRVGACLPGAEGYSSGQLLGEWKGRSLLWWAMNEREEEEWRRKRRAGPKPVPSTRRPAGP
jgi:hypothetical protein